MPLYKTANKYKTINRDDVGYWLSTESETWVKALLIFLFLYGLRIGEVLKISKGDLWTQDNYLYLRAPEFALEKNPDPYPRRLKVKADSPGVPFLVKYLESLDPEDLLFPWSRSHAWTKIKEVDPELSPHVFRHNRATEFALQGATDTEIQLWLGQSDPRTASRYRHRSGVITEKLGEKTTIL